MLDLLKNIWSGNNNKINQAKLRADSLKRLKDEYDQETLQKVFKDPDYYELQETIYEKERTILEVLNALDILYKAKETLKESLIEKNEIENPFPFQKELDENPPYMTYPWQGYTGPVVGPPPPSTSGYNGGYNQNWNSSSSPQINIPSLWPPKKKP
jgi:hypothetical protein